jgi:hypothetical protein
MPTGSDQSIARAPAGSAMLRPRTRYHQVPGASGNDVDVANVSTGVAAGVNGYENLLHWISYAVASDDGFQLTSGAP